MVIISNYRLDMRTFRNKIFTYYFILFITFTVAILLFQYNREKEFRKSQLVTLLDNVSGMTALYIDANLKNGNANLNIIDSLVEIIPVHNIRITVINTDGSVLYDSYVDDYASMENHSSRPEVLDALKKQSGSSIRHSASTGKEYFYYAKLVDNYIIRSAAEYTFEIRSFMKINKLFLLFIIVLFFLVWAALIYVNDRLGKSISSLRRFAADAAGNREPGGIDFPETELGLIGLKIRDIYQDLKNTRDQLFLEKEKIFRHLQIMEEGVAVFSSEKEMIISNKSFMQYANIMSDFSLISPGDIFKVSYISGIVEFIDASSDSVLLKNSDEEVSREITVFNNNRYIQVSCNMFKDKTFEIVLKDITKYEKNRVMKQQITSNISHELRTPLTAILGYLETLLSADDIDNETRTLFITRTRDQADRLAELLDHISVLNKLEEGSGFYEIEKVSIRETVNEVVDSLRMRIEESGATIKINISEDVSINGSVVLLNSVFQNLFDNTLNYAGANVNISLSMYFEDENFYYFRYSNDGRSIDEKHLARLFERFYRVDKGRSRKLGGTGLGLAIVKHAVQFHKGDINVKNLSGGGIEFVFSLSRGL